MILINFAHPLTPEQIEQITTRLGRAPGRVNQIALAGQASGAGFLIEQEIELKKAKNHD